jgi:5-methylcytosine-specific restriction protein B
MLTAEFGRQADLIDVHNLLWFNHTTDYDAYKGPQTEVTTEPKFLQKLLRTAERSHNIILYGPPGTGKTYWVSEYGRRFGDRVAFITFHQSFAYEDFVEGWRPHAGNDGTIRYEIRDGILKQIAARALADPDHEYLLVIDEINRANIAHVFGELITLLEDDKRVGAPRELKVHLTYSNDLFGVPKNLIIVGTMNTADRSIALLDIALRRRFTFIEVAPNPKLLPTVGDLSLSDLLSRLNERIVALLDRDHQIGHSYFMDVATIADLRFAWDHRVLPLMQEYFYNDNARLQKIIGEAFFDKKVVRAEDHQALAEIVDWDTPHYQPAVLADEDFLEALRMLAGPTVR